MDAGVEGVAENGCAGSAMVTAGALFDALLVAGLVVAVELAEVVHPEPSALVISSGY